MQKSTREYTNIKYSTEAIGGGDPLRPILPPMTTPLNINSTSCSATLPSRIRSSSRSDGIPRWEWFHEIFAKTYPNNLRNFCPSNFRPPDDIPRQMFATMHRESNGSGINLNIGPPPSCAPPTPPKKSL